MLNPEQHSENTLSKSTLFAGVIAGITALACCLGPLVLLMLGINQWQLDRQPHRNGAVQADIHRHYAAVSGVSPSAKYFIVSR